MNEREFDQWWKAHRAAFLYIDQWLGKMPTDGERRAGHSLRLDRREIPDTEVTQGDVLRTWRQTLSDISLRDALNVTASMARGDIEKPKDWDDHPRVVRRNARQEVAIESTNQMKGRFIDGEWAYKCGRCQDQGLVDIWADQSVKIARKQPELFLESLRGRYRHVVACTCAEGERMVQRFAKRKQSLRVLDDSMYLFVTGDAGAELLVNELASASVGTEWTGEGQSYPEQNYDPFKE